jgi:hypothetical protein
MKKQLAIVMFSLFVVSALIVTPTVAHAVSAHKNFIFGADSTQNVASQKGAKTKITIATPQTFTKTGEDHNWHIDGKDSANKRHIVGYFVNQASPSTPKFFAEIWSGNTRQFVYQGISAVGTNGQQKDFGFHRSASSWSYYLDTSLQAQSTASSGTTLNTVDLYALAEKICPNSPYCTKDEGGPMPSVEMPNALRYTSSSTYTGAIWSDISNANAYYQYINGDGSSSSGSGAQAEMCQPMSMKGKQQGLSNNNQLITGNNVVTTCTAWNAVLWP